MNKAQSSLLPRHRFFSPGRILTIGVNTLLELTRSKIFYFLVAFGLILLGGALLSANFSFGEEFQMLKDVALGAIGIFSTLLAILSTAMLLPKDIEDRTLYTILAKPVPRHEYLLGKLLGVFALLLVSTAVMSVIFVLLLQHRLGVRLDELGGAFDNPADLALAREQMILAAFGPGLWPGIFLVFLKACICCCFTLLLSTFATSSLFTIVMGFTVYLVGHLQGIARQYWLESTDPGWMQKLFLGVVALIFPDLQAFNLSDDVVAGKTLPVELILQLTGLGLMYCTIYIGAMLALFHGKEL